MWKAARKELARRRRLRSCRRCSPCSSQTPFSPQFFFLAHERPSPSSRSTDLSRKFGDRTVINDLSFKFDRGETLVIMGGSGCGKSTLLRHIIGVMKPTAGSVKIFGEEITTMNEREIARCPAAVRDVVSIGRAPCLAHRRRKRGAAARAAHRLVGRRNRGDRETKTSDRSD